MTTRFDRFSMCNCLTVRMEKAAKRHKIPMPIRTYTAHVMTMQLFLEEVLPGKEITIPYAPLWPKGFITTYKIPTKIKTFLFSPFNVIHHKTYAFDNDPTHMPYVIPTAPAGVTSTKYNALQKHTQLLPMVTPQEFITLLKKIEEKVYKIWGSVCMVLIFYDYSLAPLPVRKRAIAFQNAARKTVDWPVIQVKETTKRNVKDPNIWPHYSDKTYLSVLAQIANLEKEYYAKAK